MKERPILFSGEMVRAILDGRKTQTRRVVKPQPVAGEGFHLCPHCESGWAYTVLNGGACSCSGVTNRYGNPGDRLWVKETFFMFGNMPVYRASCIRDSYNNEDWWVRDGIMLPCIKWKPSIFMPRWASRITLEIVSVRLERLNTISDFDSYIEGVKSMAGTITGPYCMSYKEGYRHLWEKINGKGSWDANPFVWVIEFKRIQQEGGAK